MTVTREEVAAFADGELDAARTAEVAAALEADPALEAQVREHRALKQRLGLHFAPIMDAPLPDRLTAPLRPAPAEVVSFAAAREKRERARGLPRWSWFAVPALAASLALAVFLPRGASDGYAAGGLAATLDHQLIAAQDADAPTRVLLSFRDQTGTYCRAFAGEAQSGIACRDMNGWKLRYAGAGVASQDGDYRMAGNPAAAVLERAQAMAGGPALNEAQEAAARKRGWLR
jgi:hypothetical protein